MGRMGETDNFLWGTQTWDNLDTQVAVYSMTVASANEMLTMLEDIV